MPALPSPRTLTLLVLLGINTMNFYDRQVLGAVAEPIKRDWGLSDRQLGALGTAFILLYAVVGLPLGHWADTKRRTWILAGGVTLWSLLTALSGFAWNFWSLFVFRLGVGVGEASCAPAANSLLGDLYPSSRRARAISVFMLGLPLGLGLSFVISLWVTQHWGWRAALWVAGAPGLLLGLLALALPEPQRGAAEAHKGGTARRSVWTILRLPTMGWIILAGAVHNFNMYALGQFLAPLLIRYHGLPNQTAGWVSGIVYGFVGGLGILLGGWACDWASQRRLSGRLEVSTLALLAFVPCTYLAFQQPPGATTAFGLCLMPACLLSYSFYSGVYASIQDIIEPASRGIAMALFFCAMYFLGAAAGPFLMGWLSDHYAQQAAAADGAEELTDYHKAIGLRDALHLIPVLGILLVGVLFAASRTIRGDHEKLRQWQEETERRGALGT